MVALAAGAGLPPTPTWVWKVLGLLDKDTLDRAALYGGPIRPRSGVQVEAKARLGQPMATKRVAMAQLMIMTERPLTMLAVALVDILVLAMAVRAAVATARRITPTMLVMSTLVVAVLGHLTGVVRQAALVEVALLF